MIEIERSSSRSMHAPRPRASDRRHAGLGPPSRRRAHRCRLVGAGLPDPALAPTRRRRVLLLGLAAGSVGRAVRALDPKAEIVGVELDREVLRLARRHFGLGRLGIEIVVGDALEFLRHDAAPLRSDRRGPLRRPLPLRPQARLAARRGLRSHPEAAPTRRLCRLEHDPRDAGDRPGHAPVRRSHRLARRPRPLEPGHGLRPGSAAASGDPQDPRDQDPELSDPRSSGPTHSLTDRAQRGSPAGSAAA